MKRALTLALVLVAFLMAPARPAQAQISSPRDNGSQWWGKPKVRWLAGDVVMVASGPVRHQDLCLACSDVE